jgi:ferredoxin
MRVSITDECIACGRCVEICPEVFEMGDEFAEVTCNVVPGEYEDAVEDAAEECPVEAIVID